MVDRRDTPEPVPRIFLIPAGKAMTIAATSDSGEAHGIRALFRSDMLDRVRSVISVLINVSTLLDNGLALWHHYGVPTLRRA